MNLPLPASRPILVVLVAKVIPPQYIRSCEQLSYS
jgi:hypothetical protein